MKDVGVGMKSRGLAAAGRPVPPGRDIEGDDGDTARLAELGYRQDLQRTWTGFQNFGISFTIISVLAGCFTVFGQAWINGGPIAISWGWPIVMLLVLTVALSMAELASSFPTAGAIYWWSARLGGTVWGWFTGWFNLIGLIATVASVDYAAAGFANALLGAMGVELPGIDFTDSLHLLPETFALFVVILLLHVVINIFSSPLIGRINAISVIWHVFGVALIIALLVVVPEGHASFTTVFTERLNDSGFGGGSIENGWFWIYVLPLGFLLAMYTFTGYDASAHVSEETRGASKAAARGVWRSVFYSGVIGWVVLLAITFMITDTAVATSLGGYTPALFLHFLPATAAKAIIAIALVGQLFCGLSCVTSASRMTFAFSRDGAIPGSRFWTTLSRNRVPWAAVLFIGAWALLITVPALWGTGDEVPVAFFAVVSVAVIGLYIAYVVPIFLRWRQGSRYELGPWNLKGNHRWLNPIACIWVALCVIVFSLPFTPAGIPWDAGFSWESFNYAPATVVAVVLLATVLWFLQGRRRFQGPAEEMDRSARSLGSEIGEPPEFPEAP